MACGAAKVSWNRQRSGGAEAGTRGADGDRAGNPCLLGAGLEVAGHFYLQICFCVLRLCDFVRLSLVWFCGIATVSIPKIELTNKAVK